MNLLKPIIIGVFNTWLVLLGLYALIQLGRGVEPMLSWAGLMLSALGPLLFFVNALLFRIQRTHRHPLGYSVLCGLGLAMTMAMSYRHGPAAGVIHVWAGITLAGWLVYLRWLSGFREM